MTTESASTAISGTRRGIQILAIAQVYRLEGGP
jgi:hypothetical protein